MVLPTQAFLEDIGLSEEVGSEVYVEDEEVPEEQALNSQGSRPRTPRQASSFHTVAYKSISFITNLAGMLQRVMMRLKKKALQRRRMEEKNQER